MHPDDESRPNGGRTEDLSFPVPDRKLQTRHEIASRIVPVKILLVDDEARNLDVLESLLQSPEHELVRALTARDALILLLESEFAAIVLDVQMPDMSGVELANLIKQRRRTQHIPIIFITAYLQDDKDALVGYGSGGVDYLTKPINPQILRSKIAVFVDLFRKTRALAASNIALEMEVAQRLKAEEALRSANNLLEARVRARTADLSGANSELLAREAALRASEAQFKAASHAKDEFLAALSHELRTPLNPILLLASHSAGDASLPLAARESFESIRRNVELEARLIDDLLDLTRITRGILRLDLKPVDMHVIVRDALAIVRAEAEDKGLEVELDLGAGKSLVCGDAVRLQQVFWNLLKNAVKFTSAGGKISLESRAKPERGEWTIRVADTGIGLTSGELGRIFEAFAQGDHAHRGGSHRFGGLGLGLAISRTLVNMHAGRIDAFSDGRDRGSVFVVTLPLLQAEAAAHSAGAGEDAGSAARADQDSAPQARPNGRHVRILLVDDHAATRSTLAQLLGRHDFEVTAAGSVAEARSAAGTGRFDLVISDIGLPDGGGCELLVELRKSQPGLTGIALSGYGMEEDVARSKSAGFVEHMIKPVGIDALRIAILKAVVSGAGTSGR